MRKSRAVMWAVIGSMCTALPAVAQTYTYDELGRATSVLQPSGTQKTVYTYDNADNRLEVATFNPSSEHSPVANNDSVSAINGVATTFDPRSNDSDPDGDALMITNVGSASHGTLSFTSTSVTYTPYRGYGGNDSFTYTVADGKGGTSTATITMVISNLLSTGLMQGESQISPDGRFRAMLQTDGNFVLYYGSSSLWATGTSGSGANSAIMQTDGNLVIYNGTTVKWASKTDKHAGATISVQSDGNMVIYYGGSSIWASNTCCH